MSELLNQATDNARIEAAERELLKLPQVECPLTHWFAPGVYVREVKVPAGAVIIGAEHLGETLNIMVAGQAIVVSGGDPQILCAPYIFKSGAGVRKVAYVMEELRWLNVHPNPDNTQDLKVLEGRFVKKSAALLEHEKAALEAFLKGGK